MDYREIPKNVYRGDRTFVQNKKDKSQFFINEDLGGKEIKYFEIHNEVKKQAKLIFTSEGELNRKTSDYDGEVKFEPRYYDEIIFIFDFNNLAEKLDIKKVENIILKFYQIIKDSPDKTNLSLIIQNCLIEDKEYQPIFNEIIHFNKFEISDELYSFSPNINTLFSNVRAYELTLKKFKFNSKSQLLDFSNFIISSSCKKLTLDDFFIELIIKKDEKDEEYNDLDIYFSFIDNFITINNQITDINSLTLRDCPLFAMIENTFSFENINAKKYIDIDQNSLLNPSIITKFKIDDGKCDICFDLDAFKLRLEEKEKELKEKKEEKMEKEGIEEKEIKKEEEENESKYGLIHYLNYIFNILAPNFGNYNKDFLIDILEDDGIKDISINSFHKLIFKNFDMTKYEYVTGDDMTYIEEKNWILNDVEKQRKAYFERFEDLLNQHHKKTLPQVKELVFDNCSNYFIEWVLQIIKGRSVIHSRDYDFDLLKIKKCGNGYVDISRILKWKIKKLILFDTPLIVGKKFPEKNEKHLNEIRESLGTVDYLTIKINSLDCYGKENNLNIMKTYEILIELIECEKFNKNLIFEMNALSSIMTYLAYIKYVQDQKFYNDPNSEEDGQDDIKENQPKGQDVQILFEEDAKYLPRYIFLSSKKFRDYLCSQSFKLNLNLAGPITIKNTTIKKCYENYENQNYLVYKIQSDKYKGKAKPEGKVYTTNKELRKMDFGSDGFYIERDYKFFFFENQIKVVKLENVAFSNFRDNNIEGKNNRDFETINNLIGKNKYGNSIKKYENNQFKYPNYVMDMKTFNGIFCVNYGYENVTEFFKHYFYKAHKDEYKEAMYYDIKSIKKTFDNFINNNIELYVIINTIKEQKEFYCLSVLLNYIMSKEFINDPNDAKGIPEARGLEKKLINYFTTEKNENEDKVYSDMNYYNISEGEEKMVNEKSIMIANFKIEIDIRFNSFDEYV